MASPQDAFDARIQQFPHGSGYRGRADLDHLQSDFSALPIDVLVSIRQNTNDALAVEGQHIADDAPHAPLYFDYIESYIVNALAFTDNDHSFVGVTIPLVNEVWQIAGALSQSTLIAHLGLPPSTDRGLFAVVLFRALLNFIIGHEYAHHTHGHLHLVGSAQWEEIRTTELRGSLTHQACEADADGWAAYLALTYWLRDPTGRQEYIASLNIHDLSSDDQDMIWFSCFIVASASFTLLREPETLDATTAYRLTHPPQVIRLKMLTWHVRKWCGEFGKPLMDAMTPSRFTALIQGVTALLWTQTRAGAWDAQIAFLASPEGQKYNDAFEAEFNAFRRTLGQSRSKA